MRLWFDAVTLPEQLRALVQRQVQDIKPQTPRKRFAGIPAKGRLKPRSLREWIRKWAA